MNGKCKYKISAVALILAMLLCVCSLAAVTTAYAAGGTYYICYESDDYRVRAANVLKADGDAYSISPYLNRGDKFLISDGAGKLWGDEKGRPVAVTESGRHRYSVRFSPDTEPHVTVSDYLPAEFSLSSNGTSLGTMTYLKANPAREEYFFYADLEGGETVTVTDKNGAVYGEYGLSTDGVTVPLKGSYRFAFTADEENLFEDDKYIIFEEMPELYLMCEDGGFAENENFRFERDESVIAYAQYRAEIEVKTKDCELKYSVYDKSADETYEPSESGKVTVKDKGTYYVLYSPTHVYSASGDFSSHTALRRKDEYFDGWYVLGDFNGFSFIKDSDGFDENYRLVKDAENTDYDEYKLTLKVTDAQIKDFDGRVEFYISDGAQIHRKPNGENIGIDEAGEYELVFSPTHDYGRGYHYRYTRVADAAEKTTVTVRSADEFLDILANCTSPEYSLNKTFCLAADIDLSGKDITPALIFAGEFDGMYRTVKGVTNGSLCGSLFREITADGVLRRATFEVRLDCDDENTALVGRNNGVIDEIAVLGSVRGDGYVGAVAAVNAAGGKIKNCVSRARIQGVMNVGGIVGFNAGEIKDCADFGEVNTTPLTGSDAASALNIGGIAGYSTGNILGSQNAAKVGARQGRYVGGIAGLASGGLFGCINTGDIYGAKNVGGIVGYYGRFQSNSGGGGIGDYLTGGRFEEWLDKYFGSDSGSFEESADNGVHEIYYCENTGNVYADSEAGGIAGHAGATLLKLTACVSTGNISSRGAHAGGIVGEFGEGVVSGCLSYGDVIASGDFAGGIVGSAIGLVENSQSSAYVKAKSYVGGIVGSASGKITGCVSYAFVDGEDNKFLGMVAGAATAENCEYNYYLSDGALAGGIDGVSYGDSNNYAACALESDKLMSEGMLSSYLVGLAADDWLAGETEPRYPAPRALVEIREPDIYSDKSAFKAAYERVKKSFEEAADLGSRTIVTVTFYTYDFAAEEHERAAVFRLRKGEGIAEKDIPALEEDDGYFVWWDRTDFSSFEENTRVMQMFDRAETTLASDDTMTPLVIVEGMFRSDTELMLEYNGEYISPKLVRPGGQVDHGSLTVKYYVGDDDSVKIRLVRGSVIVDAETTRSGKYLRFTLEEGWEFAPYKDRSSLVWLWITLSALGGALIAATPFVITILVKRKKKSAAAKNAE